jgi:hypothetical protein
MREARYPLTTASRIMNEHLRESQDSEKDFLDRCREQVCPNDFRTVSSCADRDALYAGMRAITHRRRSDQRGLHQLKWSVGASTRMFWAT